MSLNENMTPDPMDHLLREYLLKHNPVGPGGDSLMETAFNHQEITSVPPLAQENEIIARLKDKFAPKPAPVPGPAPGTVQFAIFSGLAVAVSLSLLFLFLNHSPVNPTTENPANPSISGIGTLQPSDLNTDAEQNNLPAMNDLNGNPDQVELNAISELNGNPDARKVLSDSKRTGFSPGLGLQEDHNPKTENNAVNVSVDPLNPSTELINPFPLRDFFRQTSIASQYYKVDNQTGMVIRAKNGTLLQFPALCFIAGNGQPVQGNVTVEIKEVYKAYEFLLSNLPTISNGRQLAGGGAVYLDAEANGQPVTVADDKPVYIEYASQAQSAGAEMQVFQGNYNFRGELNFVPAPRGQRTRTMIALPLDELGFDAYGCNCGKYWNDVLYEITDKSFQKTWIATREFKQRIDATRRLSEDVEYYMTEIMRIYRDNVDKELWQVDRMAGEFLREKQRLEAGQGREYKDEVFEEFAAQMLTTVEPFNDFGLNFEDGDIRNQLLRKGVKEAEADRLIHVYALTRQYLGNPNGGIFMGDLKKKRLPPKMKAFADLRIDTRYRDANVGYRIEGLGWNGIASIMNTSFASSGASLDVHLKGPVTTAPANTYLVMAGLKSILPGRQIGNDEARFKDLNPNASAYIVSIAYEGGVPYFGMKKVTLKGARKEEITLAAANVDEIIAQLKAIK